MVERVDLHQRGQETADLQSADIATNRPLQMVGIERLELSHPNGPKILSLVRLSIPPYPDGVGGKI